MAMHMITGMHVHHGRHQITHSPVKWEAADMTHSLGWSKQGLKCFKVCLKQFVRICLHKPCTCRTSSSTFMILVSIALVALHKASNLAAVTDTEVLALAMPLALVALISKVQSAGADVQAMARQLEACHALMPHPVATLQTGTCFVFGGFWARSHSSHIAKGIGTCGPNPAFKGTVLNAA